METPKFNVAFLEEAADFLNNLEEKARDKVIYNIKKSSYYNDKKLFKKLTEHVWEFRTIYNKTHYRLFAFWDKSETIQTVVIATHGLIKKTDRTPQRDLDKAERLRVKYFELKDK